MKKIILAGLILISAASIKCQQIYFGGGQTISNMIFENSESIVLENLQSSNFSYMNLGYRNNIFIDNLFLSGLVSYNGYGTVGSDQIVDNYFAWDLTYLGINIGLDYEFYKPGNFAFYIKGEGSLEFLIRGSQTLNNQIYDLKGEEDFDSPIYMLRGGLGVQYKISNKVLVFTQYMYGTGSPFKTSDSKLNIRSNNIGVGVLIDLFKDAGSSGNIVTVKMEEMQKDMNEALKEIKQLEKETERVEVLEEEIAVKETEIVTLKDTISSVLFDFSTTNLDVDLDDGKIYVTLENDMLFQSGSWNIEEQGFQAIKSLASVITENPDVDILIEGHTDNQPFKGSGNIQNNWDLSTKRAATIVNALVERENIDPSNLTAAGRGEFNPIADNETLDGRAKNRRIEVIISPKLDEVFDILNK